MATVVVLGTGVAYSQQPSADEVEKAIRYIWPDSLEDYAVAIARCESHLAQNPNTYNQIHTGAFQFSIVTWQPYFEGQGYNWDDIVYDPYWNAWAAWVIYDRSGFGAWPNCP